MKYGYLSTAMALALTLAAAPGSAQKTKKADISGIAFISGPKGDRTHLPGLNAVLQLTEEQKEKLIVARQETIGSESVVSAGKKVKGDPNASDADRQAARKAAEDAQAQFQRRIGEVLTAPQKELIQRIQVVYNQSREAVTADYSTKLAGAKGNETESTRLRREMRDALTADFSRRVNEFLTPEQRSAFERAAAEEKARGTDKPKSSG